jgi:dCMP deaminase
MNWTEYHIQLADQIAQKSKDPSTKVGCVIAGDQNQVLTTGFNGFPIGVDGSDEGRWERPQKYDYVCHAERNAIHFASRNGVELNGSTMYVNKNSVCLDCCKAIIQAGIKKVVVPKKEKMRDKWQEEMKRVKKMFDESGVEFVEFTSS